MATNSWQPFVDESLLKSGNVDKAAIYGKSDFGCWAQNGFGQTIKPDEASEMVKILDGKEATGFTVADDKYIMTRQEKDSLYGRKGKEGIVIVRTAQTLIIAHYPETVQPGAATNTVEKLGDHLRQYSM